MVVAISMPRQGQSVETCIITRWHKSKGDKVSAGDILFSYETDKAAFDEEAKDEGILLEIFFGEGDEVPVLETVAVIGNEGDDYQSLIPSGFAGQTDSHSPTESQKGEKDASANGSSAGNGTGKKAGSGSENTDTGQKTVPGDAAKTKPGSQAGRGDKITPDIGTGGDRIKISPLARRMAGELDLPLEGIRGTGPLGRIIERDIKKAAAETRTELLQTGEAPEVRSEVEPYYRSAGSQGASQSGKQFTLRKLSNMRRIIARRMEESLRNSAQLTHHMSADARKLLAWRREIKASREAAGKTREAMPDIGINDMVCHAVIRALKSHPYMNAHFTGDGIREFSKVHLGIAVDTTRGLMVPVLENADDMNIGGLAERIRGLAGECREGSIDPELLASENASFTVTNLGSYGVEMFTPVLNLPQVGILGVNAITLRPADLGDGATGFIPMIGISLTYDHRAVDGAPASVFLAAVKKEIEETSAGRL
jgi:pyruvate dehydrogenase E2 component (dihydrolipoamide acetyltransferase)